MIGDSNEETNFPHKLLLTDRKVSKLRKAFANSLLANINLLKTHLSKIVQPGGILGRLFGPLLKTAGLPLIKNVFKPLATSVSIPLGLFVDTGIHKKILWLLAETLISNEEMDDIMRVVKSFEESGLMMKVVSETI